MCYNISCTDTIMVARYTTKAVSSAGFSQHSPEFDLTFGAMKRCFQRTQLERYIGP